MENKNIQTINENLNILLPLLPKDAGLTYSFSIVFYLLLSLIFSFVTGGIASAESKPIWYVYASYCIAPIALCVVAFGIKHKNKYTFKQIGYKKCHYKYFLLALGIVVGVLGSLSWVNVQFANLLEKLFGYKQPVSSLNMQVLGGAKVLIALLVVCVLPAVFEETIFRGFILEGTKKLGTVLSIVFSGLLFSIYHMNPAQTIYQFVCGCIFSLLALRANSVLPAILAHFLNNALVIIFYICFGENFVFPWYVIIVSALILIGCLVYLIGFDKETNSKREEKISPLFKMGAMGIFVCVVMWIAALIEALG